MTRLPGEKKPKNSIYKIHKCFTRDSFFNMGISGTTREGSIMAELGKEGRKLTYLVDLVKAPLPMGHWCIVPTKSFPAYLPGYMYCEEHWGCSPVDWWAHVCGMNRHSSVYLMPLEPHTLVFQPPKIWQKTACDAHHQRDLVACFLWWGVSCST